jgi:hypothetical protein
MLLGKPTLLRLLWIFLIIVLLFCAAAAVLFPRTMMQMLLPDQTIYASGFSEQKFSQVRRGMSEAEVLGILGQPLEVYEYASGRKYPSPWSLKPSTRTGVEFRWWSYSKSGRLYDSYAVRAIKFDPSGRVVDIDHSYYND